jgi:zinc D-Ala-D-Ala carboxypeptidase
LSAPPGYSEHHTGFALDIGDGSRPEADVKFEFENTKAYQWLQANGRRYGLEISFPANNIQGVSFEPWHWRFTSSPYATAVFSVAHTLVGEPTNASTQ